MHKLIMTSAVYMQHDRFDEKRAIVDSGNRLHWRRTPRRLEAEAIRDAMLSISGLLDRSMYGTGSLDQGMRRRSIYFTIKRSKLVPTMMLFDWPEHLVSIGRRPVTTTAPQALWFMNNTQTRLYADGFAKQIVPYLTGGSNDQPPDYLAAIERAYQTAYARIPVGRESEIADSFIRKQIGVREEVDKQQAVQRALADLCHMILSGNEFVYIR